MIQNYGSWRVLQVFFDNPNPEDGFTIRWISKKIGLAPTSVKLHLGKFLKKGLIVCSKGISYPTYRANNESGIFRFYKKLDMLVRLEESGILDFLSEEFSPLAIVLFGSAARGEDDSLSDIDIFILAKKKEANLLKYGKILNRKIELHFSESINSIPKELRNNILNGIILRGYLEVF